MIDKRVPKIEKYQRAVEAALSLTKNIVLRHDLTELLGHLKSRRLYWRGHDTNPPALTESIDDLPDELIAQLSAKTLAPHTIAMRQRITELESLLSDARAEIAGLREAAKAVSDAHWHEWTMLEMRPLVRKLDDLLDP